MYEISLQDTQDIAGGNFFFGWIASQLFTAGVTYAWNAASTGQIDYAGVAESQGSYYNMVGA